MKMLKTILVSGTMLTASPVFAADIVIGVGNWPSINAAAHIMKVAIEQNLGYEVELQNGTNPIIFEAMDSGAMHVHPEVWLPNQQNLHDKFVKDKGSVAMNSNGVESFQGMCVDQATADAHGITSINDLTNPDIAAIFDSDGDGQGELWIGVPGWASTNVEKIRAKSYGYDQTFTLTAIDETVAYGQLGDAIKAGKPWAGFCYTPHYVFELHDLAVLEEPAYDATKWNVTQPTDSANWFEESSAPVAWDSAYLHIHYAKSLEQDYPDVATLLSNMKFDTQTVSGMTFALVIDGQEPLAYAKQWVADNEDAILRWLSN